jgi:ATP-dependent DNA helicase RecG
VESYCLLLYQAPLSKIAQERLGIIRDSTDGFLIAQKDLEIRGPGEVLGTRQTGVLNLKVADLEKDKALFADIPQAGQWMLENYPEQCELLIQRWIKKGFRYGVV